MVVGVDVGVSAAVPSDTGFSLDDGVAVTGAASEAWVTDGGWVGGGPGAFGRGRGEIDR